MIRKDPVTVLPLERLELNEGQIDWLPRNPRQSTKADIERTKESLDEDADFLQDRPLLAVPGPEGKLVVFAGNLRLTAARSLGWPGVPVVVYHPEGIAKEDRETIKRRALKDNGTFGSWDADILANEWDAEPWQLEQWGVPDWLTGGAGKGMSEDGTAGGSSADGAPEQPETGSPDKKNEPETDEIDIDAAKAEAETWIGGDADAAFLAGAFFALFPDRYDPSDFSQIDEFFHR